MLSFIKIWESLMEPTPFHVTVSSCATLSTTLTPSWSIINSFPPYLEDLSTICNLWIYHAVVVFQRTYHLSSCQAGTMLLLTHTSSSTLPLRPLTSWILSSSSQTVCSSLCNSESMSHDFFFSDSSCANISVTSDLCSEATVSCCNLKTLWTDSKAQHLKSINKTNIHILCLSSSIARPCIISNSITKLKLRKGKVPTICN